MNSRTKSLSPELIDVIDHGGDHSDLSQVLIFLHPGMGAKETWDRFPQLLCDELKVSGIVYSRPEYERHDGHITLSLDFMEREADRLQSLLVEDDIKHALLIGSSDGASIALAHAARFHDRVKCVVSIAAHVMIDQVMVEALERLRREATSEPTPQWLVSQFGADAVATALAWCDTWATFMASNWSMEDKLTTVTCPVLAMQGSEDRNGTLRQLDAIAAKVPDCRTVVLPELGHFPFRQAPEELCRQVTPFLRSHLRRP